MGFIKKYQLLITTFFVGVSMFFSCTKEKKPIIPTVPEPTLWEKVNGHYKVYDTTGVYLYDMSIVHIHVNDQVDSLRFENFDGEFTFTVKQSSPNPSNYPNYIDLGYHMMLYDLNSKRWKLGGATYEYYNSYNNDTLPLRFLKTNINYYIEDVTPYYTCDCKQIAVKQH
nr:hypothetical protein [uncultured Fluviicola sp.]